MREWITVAAVLLLAGALVVYLVIRQGASPAVDGSPEPLKGELQVFVRSLEPGGETLLIDEPGALPVRAGQLMNLQVSLNQPAFVYLVWLDCEGRVVPLYPWNKEDEMQVKDVNEPVDAGRGKVVRNPMTLGKGWTFGKRGGLETILLLVRRTALPDDVRLGGLLGTLPVAKMRMPDELAVLGLDHSDASVSTLLEQSRGNPEEARKADEPLRTLMGRLQKHFDLIRVVRFAHEGE